MDVELKGKLEARGVGMWLDLPLQVTLRGTTLRLPGTSPTAIAKLDLPLGIRGPLASPSVRLDDKALTDALVAAGKAELAGQVQKLAGNKVDEALKGKGGKAAEAAQKKANELKKLVPGGIFGGKKDKK